MLLPLARKAGLIHVLALGQAGLAVVPVLEDRRHGEGGVVYKGTLAFHSSDGAHGAAGLGNNRITTQKLKSSLIISFS